MSTKCTQRVQTKIKLLDSILLLIANLFNNSKSGVIGMAMT